ncbi:MAG: hypothetical protein J6U70_07575 [Bacteroidales bacterium]|nr:hypothetical protein [Bacteroidales bacterium]
MKTKAIFAGILACIGITVQAQDANIEESKGKAIVQAFGNFHTGLGAHYNDRGFDLERSYLGYEYKLTEGLTVKGVMDIGQSNDVSDYQRIAYIKNAMITWKKDRFTLNGGLISNNQFNFQEKFWGYRYVMKSFQDLYKFGHSADLGLSVAYEFADWIAADAIIVNGEGYKKIQRSNGLAYGLGVTMTPVEGLQLRLYGGLNEGGAPGERDVTNFAAFAGYKHERFSIGAEFNKMWNASHRPDADQQGYSVFASFRLSDMADLYVRYDDLASRNDWNRDIDQALAILGAQFKLGKYVKIAPNLRMSMPKAAGANHAYAAFISCYFGL